MLVTAVNLCIGEPVMKSAFRHAIGRRWDVSGNSIDRVLLNILSDPAGLKPPQA